MYRYSDIRQVHLEVTSRCNASCPMCARNQHGGAVNPNLPMAELRLAQLQKLIPSDFTQQLTEVYLCGNYGDALVAHDTADMLEYLRASNPGLALRLFTNGSGRNAAWWARLAAAGVIVRFSIDGLADTNHRYRIGTQWDRIMAACEAFIGAGGEAEWDYLVFRHNEHQVEDALALARRMGFRKFYVKRTARFFGDKLDVRDRRGQVVDVLWMPESNEFRNTEAEQQYQLRLTGEFQKQMETTPITCKAVERRSIYISAEGLVLPCCWLAQLYPPNRPWEQDWRRRLKRMVLPFYTDTYTEELWRLLQRVPSDQPAMGGKQVVNGLCDQHRGTREIIEGPLFQQSIPASWQATSLKSGRLEACARECGADSPTDAQYEESRI
jgi:MoaA/NifB/PqqE/SkfB family radical SAM enzyme